jgi:uncharacterized protein YbaR (Trm112 family)
VSLPEDLLHLLACPACHGPLRLVADGAGLACAACAVIYPVDDGIPVLLTEEAVALDVRERRRDGRTSG